MKLYYDRRARDPIYYIQQGIRNGKKTTTRNVRRIGKHSELLKDHPDPLAYAKEQVRIMNEEMQNDSVTLEYRIDFSEPLPKDNISYSRDTSVNVGYFFLQRLWNDMKMKQFLKKIQDEYKAEFSLDDIMRFLTFDRMLDPGSKLSTVGHLSSYYEKPQFSHQQVLRAMDIINDHTDDIITHLYKKSGSIVDRDTSVCYLDFTSYYFETETDDDYVDKVTGELIHGFRKYGPSKEHRPNPLVSMGLFMDARGIPITMCLEPGNQNEQKSALPLERNMSSMIRGKPFIYCADAGLGSTAIRLFNDMGERSFIVTQSVKKLRDTYAAAVFNDYDYRILSTGTPVTIEHMKTFDRFDEKNLALYQDVAYKEIIAESLEDLGLYEEKIMKNGRTRRVKAKGRLRQRIIITFSRKMMEYQRSVRNRQIERAEAIIRSGDPESRKKGPHDVSRFIKRESSSDQGGEVKDVYSIDRSLIEEEERYDGFYAIATNTDLDVRKIIDIQRKRYRIEESFRILKSDFSARPAYHRLEKRLRVHFLICFISLLLYRLIEALIEDSGRHYTSREILETLRNMNVVNMNDVYYASIYTGSDVCDTLSEIFRMGMNKKYYKPKVLNKNLKKSQN